MTTLSAYRTVSTPAPWHDGVTWYSRRIVDPTVLPLDVAYVSSQILRLADEGAEYDLVESYIRAATQAAEDDTQRALMPQTWQMVLSGFPSSGRIVLERPPLLAVTSVAYYDGDGDAQELAVSPADFELVASGAYRKGEVRVLDAGTFPSTSTREDAVVITYRAGYEEGSNDPTLALIKTGIGLMVAELYETRKLSVQATHNTPSQLNLQRFWRKVY